MNQSNIGQEARREGKETLEEVWRSIDINKFREEDMNNIINRALDYRIAEPVQQEIIRLVRLVQRVTLRPDESKHGRWMNGDNSQPRQTNLPNAKCTDNEGTICRSNELTQPTSPNSGERRIKGNGKTESGLTERSYVDQCLSWAGLTIAALLKPDPEIVLARGLMTTIETEMLRQTPILGRIVGVLARNQMFPVASGLFLNIAIMVLAGLGWWWLGNISDESAVYQQYYRYSILTMQAAFLGGIISLIVRLPSSSALQDQSVVIMFLTAFFKPWVALVFGGVVFMLMNSEGVGVHLINPDVLKDPHFWGVVGFISGWSERFAPDIITRAAERVQTGREDPRPGLGGAAERPRDQTLREGQTAQDPPPPSPRRDDTATAEGREATDVRRL